ncbi:MAG: hypothetical protein SNJ33_03060 [Rikenellaceae bacterium]
MQDFTIDNQAGLNSDYQESNSHASEEALFNSEVIQDDHELYYIHHYIDSMGSM